MTSRADIELILARQSLPTTKVVWKGTVTSVQPRIRMTRSFDQRAHSYLGYTLAVDGVLDGQERKFKVAIGKSAQEKHSFRVGMVVSGAGYHVRDPRLETANIYKASQLRVLDDAPEPASAPPWTNSLPTLTVYRERGHRRLDPRAYATPKCSACIWACEMPVELIVDQWKPTNVRYRTETWCYGPKSCEHYRAGPKRKAPGRKGMSYTEEDWVDEQETADRDEDQ